MRLALRTGRDRYIRRRVSFRPRREKMRARWKSLVAKLLVLSGTSLLCLVIFESVLLVRAGYYKNFEGETASITYVNRIYWQPDLISGYRWMPGKGRMVRLCGSEVIFD